MLVDSEVEVAHVGLGEHDAFTENTEWRICLAESSQRERVIRLPKSGISGSGKLEQCEV
jgi:hypothetical protein